MRFYDFPLFISYFITSHHSNLPLFRIRKDSTSDIVFPFGFASFYVVTVFDSTLETHPSLFAFFLNYRPQISFVAKKIISSLSTLSFGIYLLHEHNQVRDILWGELVHLTDYIGTPARFLAQAWLALAAIAAAGLLLECIRRMITNCICKIGNRIIGR